ncbi:hypothetical protein T492DRAFT_80230 [Pavlovales sp. CCMP2436]|nr:hypothetical protein T492DRAFT_80230 [Pavlovales sp. CCMP2436]
MNNIDNTDNDNSNAIKKRRARWLRLWGNTHNCRSVGTTTNNKKENAYNGNDRNNQAEARAMVVNVGCAALGAALRETDATARSAAGRADAVRAERDEAESDLAMARAQAAAAAVAGRVREVEAASQLACAQVEAEAANAEADGARAAAESSAKSCAEAEARADELGKIRAEEARVLCRYLLLE